MAIFNSIYDAVDAVIQKYSLPKGGAPVATVSRAVVDVNGNVVYAGDGPLDNVESNTELVTAFSPVTAASQTINAVKKNESLIITPAGTIAALTVVFPSDVNSRVGQEIRITSHQIVTALTLTTAGLTILGSAVTALAVDTPVIFKKIGVATFARTL